MEHPWTWEDTSMGVEAGGEEDAVLERPNAPPWNWPSGYEGAWVCPTEAADQVSVDYDAQDEPSEDGINEEEKDKEKRHRGMMLAHAQRQRGSRGKILP